MGIVSALLGAIVGIFFLAWAISAFFMFVAAKISSVENATFGKALVAALGCSFITWLCALVFSVVPIIGTVLGIVVGVTLSIFVIKGVFNATFGRAFLVWLFNGLGQIAAVVIAVLTFAGALFGVSSHVVQSVTSSAQASATAFNEGTVQDAKSVAAALEAYATDMNVYPAANSTAELASALVPRYIKQIPPGLQIKSSSAGYQITSASGQPLLNSNR
jgi:hypothetical protein